MISEIKNLEIGIVHVILMYLQVPNQNPKITAIQREVKYEFTHRVYSLINDKKRLFLFKWRM